MKKRLPLLLALLSCLLTIACLAKIAALQDQLANAQSNLSGQMNSVNASVGGIYANVAEMLREQASLLAAGSYEFAAFDAEDLSVEVVCSVTPKEFSPAVATAVLVCNGEEYPMRLSNGSFSVALTLPVFARAEITAVRFLENGVARSEALDWRLAPRHDFLPDVFASFNGSRSGGNSYRCSGTINIDVEGTRPVEVASLTLVQVLDGEEVGRTALDPRDGATTDGGGLPVQPAQPAASKDGQYRNYSFTLEETYTIPNGGTHKLYVEMADGYGLRYRVLIDSVSLDQDGNPNRNDEEWRWRSLGADIYDAAGNLLYDAAGELSY